jgi:hypothetical protein
MTNHLRSVCVLALVIALAGCTDAASDIPLVRATADTAPPSPTLGAIPSGEAPIEPGTYQVPRSAWAVRDFTVTFPQGWMVQYGHVYLKHWDAPEEVSFYAVVVDQIYSDACEGEGELIDVGPSVEDLVAALQRQKGPNVSDPVKTTLGGYPATRIDMTVPKRLDVDTCRFGEFGLQVWYSPPADKYFVLLNDGIASVYILDIDGQRQVFLTQYRSETSDADVRELQEILDSIRIETE